MPDSPTNLFEQITFNTGPGANYEREDPSLSARTDLSVAPIAFYLPQFHTIPENDAWWGQGFTEWTNVTKAIPRFRGHLQPRLPGDLGFYDLTNIQTLRRQAALAKRYGIRGFCFHHYWFFGKPLLETPISLLLANSDVDLPFCINWANESWTRRWDGHEKSVLIAQQHSPEDDFAFAASIEPYVRDPRYIRLNGRPLIMLYRPGALPNAAHTVSRWRSHFIKAGLGNPFIVMAQAFAETDWAKYGMDAAVGFPPFWAGVAEREAPPLLDPKFRGVVKDYSEMAEATMASYALNERVFPGVCPAWDNDSRRPGRGICFVGSTPERYGAWLDVACRYAIQQFPKGERLVFINAWNEWAEGAYLEPDRHFGHAYLAETARVLNRLDESASVLGRPTSTATALTPPPTLTLYRHARRLARRVLNLLAGVADDISWKLRKL